MNEKARRILSYVAVFILGGVLATGTTVYFAQRTSNRAIESLRSTNTRLEAELTASRGFISNCERIIGSAQSTSAKLRAIIEALPDDL